MKTAELAKLLKMVSAEGIVPAIERGFMYLACGR
jgi:hypothetical protein